MNYSPLFLSLTVGLSAVCCLQGCQPADNTIAPGARSTVVAPSDSAADPAGVYSRWFSVHFVQAASTYDGSIAADDLTDDLLNDSYVQVQMRDGDKIVRLPYTQYVNETPIYIYASFQPGKIDIIASGELANRQFRYILTPHKPPLSGDPFRL